MLAHFENGENVMDRPSVCTKKVHVLPADFEKGRFLKIEPYPAHFENGIVSDLEND